MATIDESQYDEIKALILERLRHGRNFWKPLHARMDYWATMYLLLDAIQQSKPLGYRRFVSNDPRTAIDASVSILTRNRVGWHIDQMGSQDENQEELIKLGNIERTLIGIDYELDDMAISTLNPTWWVQAAQQALLRGMIWAKVHVTTQALKYGRAAPVLGQVYDARTVYPLVDSFGLNYVIIEKLTNLGALVSEYPEKFGNKLRENPNTPAVKIEYWSNNRGDLPGIMACLAMVGAATQAGFDLYGTPEGAKTAEWVIPPQAHGLEPDALPVFGVAVNGLAIRAKPALLGTLEQRLTERADLLAMQANQWHGPNTWVAEIGRSLLAAVEEHNPQFNELVATIYQHVSEGAFGTWVHQNQTAEIPDWKPGLEAQIAIHPDESVQRISMEPITPDAYRLLQLIQQERENGTLSSILRANSPQAFNSAVQFQQFANAALNTLEPYSKGLMNFGSLQSRSVLAQLQAGASELKKFELIAPGKKNTYFRIEFDPSVDLDSNRKYRPIPVMKPALPDDLTIRLTAARMALDPRRPILSLQTVLEDIIQSDDSAGEIDRIFADIADSDPVLLLERVAQALDRRGDTEFAARIRSNEFKTAYIQEAQWRQATGAGVQGLGGSQEATNPPPEAGVPTSATAPANNEPHSASEGAALMGDMGSQIGV